MMDLVLSVWSAKPPYWSAIVAERAGFGSIADEGGATLDEARDAVLAQLTPEHLAELAASMIADLAAVARAMGYTVGRERCVSVDWVMGLQSADDGGAYATCTVNHESDRSWLLGLALALDTLRRDQEAADG